MQLKQTEPQTAVSNEINALALFGAEVLHSPVSGFTVHTLSVNNSLGPFAFKEWLLQL